MSDYLVRGPLADVDPVIAELNEIEAERQYRKIILIASESTAPLAVREALNSGFNNIYAEGYPDENTRKMDEAQITDYAARLSHYRRYADPRYYKGVEYADTVEALARRRAAELFANERVSADGLYVNVQALSGGPANNAVYHALVEPGDTVMGLDLIHGGHLSHGARANRSGKYYHSVPYGIDPDTEQIDYAAVRKLALEARPKLLIGGYSSYSWAPDWEALRAIADEVGAYLLADIAHVAGLVAAGEFPSPVGIADVISFTTHKSLCGPRGSVIMTHRADLSPKIDRAVFPGEQGGPHLNTMAAMAVMFKLNNSDWFREMQRQIKANAQAFADQFQQHGFRIPFGGTNSHLFNVDCKSVTAPDGTALRGDMASRILDLAGVVLNRNTIPGDRSAFNPSGLRIGTVWITQRGFKEAETRELADLMAQVLQACTPYTTRDPQGKTEYQIKVDWEQFNDARIKLRDLSMRMAIDYDASNHGYPHFYYLDDPAPTDQPFTQIDVAGSKAARAMYWLTSNDCLALQAGQSQRTTLPTPQGPIEATLTLVGGQHVQLTVPTEQAVLALTWLRDVSDGYVAYDASDLAGEIPGPFVVTVAGGTDSLPAADGPAVSVDKPYYANPQGLDHREKGEALPAWQWAEPEDGELKRTALFETHKAMGAKMVPFAGWEMPVWYSSVSEEHAAVRNHSGLFDVSHMGVWDASGPGAAWFVDALTTNSVKSLAVGRSQYSQMIDPDGHVIDDLLVYRVGAERYLMVVNASNDDKDWAWANAVLNGEVMVDRARPWVKAPGRAGTTLRNLRDPQLGAEMRVDLALQGPASRDILLSLTSDPAVAKTIKRLPWAGVASVQLGEFNLIVSRTGYTGERVGYELFGHPERATALWHALTEAGAKPIGLAARDSLRTEAGLPLYGQEMAGPLDLGVGHAGFGGFVKVSKPWFIGRDAFLKQEAERTGRVIRFRFNEKGVRMAHYGDPVVDKRGRVVGQVTSCAIDSDGYLTGQAYVDEKAAKLKTQLGIYQSASTKADKPAAELKPGDRVRLNDWATVISRFPKK